MSGCVFQACGPLRSGGALCLVCHGVWVVGVCWLALGCQDQDKDQRFAGVAWLFISSVSGFDVVADRCTYTKRICVCVSVCVCGGGLVGGCMPVCVCVCAFFSFIVFLF